MRLNRDVLWAAIVVVFLCVCYVCLFVGLLDLPAGCK